MLSLSQIEQYLRERPLFKSNMHGKRPSAKPDPGRSGRSVEPITCRTRSFFNYRLACIMIIALNLILSRISSRFRLRFKLSSDRKQPEIRLCIDNIYPEVSKDSALILIPTKVQIGLSSYKFGRFQSDWNPIIRFQRRRPQYP